MTGATLEHIALKALNLDQTQAFYARLGGQTERHGQGQRLFVRLDGGSRLIFDQSDTVYPETVTYLGLELPDFAAVDASFAEFSGTPALDRDVRETYRHATGPYGFFVRDPSGYVVKVFKYNEMGA